MIFDRIDYTGNYKGISAALDKALAYAASTDFTKLNPGRYEVDGDRVYALVQTVQTKDRQQAKWEAHRKYIDIQFVFDGVEIMGVQSIQDMKATQPYEDGKDIVFYDDNNAGTFLKVAAGNFAVFFPEDAHMPCVADGSPAEVKKVVIKVKC